MKLVPGDMVIHHFPLPAEWSCGSLGRSRQAVIVFGGDSPVYFCLINYFSASSLGRKAELLEDFQKKVEASFSRLYPKELFEYESGR